MRFAHIMIASVLTIAAAASASAEELPANRALAVDEATAAAVPPASIVRVTGNLAGQVEWRGVRSCGDGDRVRQELQQAFDRWLGETARAHTGQTLLAHGWDTVTYWYENRRRSGRRSCKAGFSNAPVYADFF